MGSRYMNEHLVFAALSDISRRTLLDALNMRDGQSLVELQVHLPTMSRFGCMKHVRVLEDAGLLTTRKDGRRTLHYLNPVPIQMVYDRWVSKYARPATETLTGLKSLLEENDMNTHIYSIYIKTNAALLWRALTDGKLTERYYFGTRFTGEVKTGAAYSYKYPDQRDMIRGTILEADPPNKLVTTFQPLWAEGLDKLPPTTVTFEIAEADGQCKLTLTHEGLAAGPDSDGVKDGWARICSALKSMLETETV
jgi:uncharacterized protein YndB with AHSA1/START domain